MYSQVSAPSSRRTGFADDQRLEIAGIHAGVGVGADSHCLPLHHATAVLAANEFQRLVAPDVIVRCTWLGGERYLGVFVIRPQNAIAATDRAVAVRDVLRLARDVDFDGAAVAGGGWHLFDNLTSRRA